MIKPDTKQITKHLEIIAQPRNPFTHPEKLAEIESYLESEFRSYGYGTEKKPCCLNGQKFNNLIARKIPAGNSPRLIVGAHFDAVPGTYGADDNASGMAVLLESARLISPMSFASRIDFIAFNLEEYGMAGSTHYANFLKKTGTPILGMLSLEMVGYTSSKKGSQKLPLALRPFYSDIGNFLALIGDSQSADLLKKTAAAFKGIEDLPVETLTLPAKGRIFPESRLSDHAPFWDAGYPALLVTDTSFFRNPHYHLPSDRIETLDVKFICRVTEGLIRFAASLGSDHSSLENCRQTVPSPVTGLGIDN
ncbi:MAG: M28 family peptidase [Candidatus Omnitrophica bacterium]|nr:M28 family peptidase [Candidatus Omnitrophota bacterium]MDD5670220.1 M28 family peptidase [Candidatus Omnitrophota bacterium]